MGNAQFKLDEGNGNLSIDKSLLKNYQKHITIVDHALTGLARGIDALETTCQLFLQQYAKPADVQNKETGATASEGAVILIIQKIHECISNNKEVTIESMKNFFSFIKETGGVYIENTDEAFSSLSINTYHRLLPDYKTQDGWLTDFYKKRSDHLEKEIEMLQKSRHIQQKLIENLKKELSQQSRIPDKEEFKSQIKDWIEQNSHAEKISEESSCESNRTEALLKSTIDEQPKTSHEQIKTEQQIPITAEKIELENDKSINILHENMALRKELIDCRKMHENIIAELRKQVHMLEEDNSKMQTELHEMPNISKITTKKVIVQVFSRYVFSSIKDAEEDLLVLLKTDLLKRGLELAVVRCQRLSQVVDGCPLLVTINHYNFSRRKNGTISAAMSGLENGQNKAVVVFHLIGKEDLPKELELYEKQYTSVGKVIHFGYKSELYSSQLNKESIQEVIAFIERFGIV